MGISIAIKSLLGTVFHGTGINALKLRRYSANDCVILMYHRILPGNEIKPWHQAGMIVEPDTLDMQLRYLNENFQIIHLAELIAQLTTGTQRSCEKPLCVITFDDGWIDFFEHAYPILKLHETPATVFLPTDFIGTGRWFWTDRLGSLLSALQESGFDMAAGTDLPDPILSEIFNLKGTYDSRLDSAISLLKSYRYDRIENVLDGLAAVVEEGPVPELGRSFLAWEEVLNMGASGLISYGSHTAGHPILSTLADNEIMLELEKSKECLLDREIVDPEFIPFCYPNGNYSGHISDMVRAAGYHLAVTTEPGWNSPGVHPYGMRRVAIHQDMTSTPAMFESRLVGTL